MKDEALIRELFNNFERKVIPDIVVLGKIDDEKTKIMIYGIQTNIIKCPKFNVENETLNFFKEIIDKLTNDEEYRFKNAITEIKIKYELNYSICTIPKKNKFVELEILAKEEYEQIKYNLDNINKYINLYNKIEGFKNEVEKLNSLIKKFKTNVISEHELTIEFKDITERIFSKFKTYLDTTKAYLHKNYINIESNFKDLTEKEYKNNFAYRYCYHLRNAIQHNIDYPFEKVNYKLIEEEKLVYFLMSNKYFLKNHSGFNRNPKAQEFKKELEKDVNKEINIYQQILGLEKSVTNVHNQLISTAMDNKLFKSMIEIYEYKVRYTEYNNYCIINNVEMNRVLGKLKNTPNSEETYKDSMYLIPMDFIEYCLKVVSKKS
jgi:hypothetical protein